MNYPKNIQLNLPSNEPVILERNKVTCLQWRNWLALVLACGIIYAAYEFSFMSKNYKVYFFEELFRGIGLEL